MRKLAEEAEEKAQREAAAEAASKREFEEARFGTVDAAMSDLGTVMDPDMAIKILNEAHDILSKAQSRAEYDRFMATATFDEATGRRVGGRAGGARTMTREDVEAQSDFGVQQLREEYLAKHKTSKAINQWFVGQREVTDHQMYFNVRHKRLEKEFDRRKEIQDRGYKYKPISRARSMLWLASPFLVAGLWGFGVWRARRTDQARGSGTGYNSTAFDEFKKKKKIKG
jgi:curved DNA-binding protein CbpA